ncbi:MAG: pyridoxamine 5'-phosphate oxidase family protein [Candidatus Saccharibacteria bacterium]
MPSISLSQDKQARIRKELTAAGMNAYGLLKAEARHLPGIIHDDETIGAAIYGRAEAGGSGMLVATSTRLLYLDHKLFFRKTDEISYDVISGVSTNRQGRYNSVTVHTKLGDFSLRFVNEKSTKHFVHFIEKMQIERTQPDVLQKNSTKNRQATVVQSLENSVNYTQAAKLFLSSHNAGVISTVGSDGEVHGSVVYYTLGVDSTLFFATKDHTTKSMDITTNPNVAFTIFDANEMQTLQISGTAHIEQDPTLASEIKEQILRPHFAGTHVTVPPILHISAGTFTVICIKPTTYSFHDYKTWK